MLPGHHTVRYDILTICRLGYCHHVSVTYPIKKTSILNVKNRKCSWVLLSLLWLKSCIKYRTGSFEVSLLKHITIRECNVTLIQTLTNLTEHKAYSSSSSRSRSIPFIRESILLQSTLSMSYLSYLFSVRNSNSEISSQQFVSPKKSVIPLSK